MTNEIRATRLAEGTPSDDPDAAPPIDSPIEVGQEIELGESVAGGPFLEHLFWSPDSRYLAFTLADTSGEGTDVWLFNTAAGEVVQRTDVGDAYAASWAFGGAGSQTAFGPRGAATLLSKATSFLAIVFMLTSLSLAIFAGRGPVSSVVPADTPATEEQKPAEQPPPQQQPPPPQPPPPGR